MIAKTSLAVTLLCLLVGGDALRWAWSGLPATKDTIISLLTMTSKPKIDIAAGEQVTFLRNANVKTYIIIYCFIEGVIKGTTTEYHFCKNDDCDAPISENANITKTAFNMKMHFETSSIGKIGVTVKMTVSKSKKDHSGHYYCKASNGKFAIRSNYIEIRDVYYWQHYLFTSTQVEEKSFKRSISDRNIPLLLSCSGSPSLPNPAVPSWTKAEFVSPVTWSVCPVFKNAANRPQRQEMTLDRCVEYTKNRCDDGIDDVICPASISIMTKWKAFVDQKGDLLFTDNIQADNVRIDSYSFLCYTNDLVAIRPIVYYYHTKKRNNVVTKGITFDDARKEEEMVLEPISNMTQTFEIYARKITRNMYDDIVVPVTVHALYRGPAKATYQWWKDGQIFNTNHFVRTGPYTLTFPGTITLEQTGRYILDVTYKRDTLKMEVNVRVVGPPVLVTKGCMPLLKYVWIGDRLRITCEYKQGPKNIKLTINDQEIGFDLSKMENRANLRENNPYLEKLELTARLHKINNKDHSRVSYSVKNMAEDQDHIVTLLASNDLGMSLSATSVFVLPRLTSLVNKYPENDSCITACSSSEQHIFNCEIRVEDYNGKELIVDHFWTINSHRVTDKSYILSDYFQVDPDTKKLTMSPIGNAVRDKKVKRILKDNFILCEVTLRHIKDKKIFAYKSFLDSSLGDRMKALIKLDYDVPVNPPP